MGGLKKEGETGRNERTNTHRHPRSSSPSSLFPSVPFLFFSLYFQQTPYSVDEASVNDTLDLKLEEYELKKWKRSKSKRGRGANWYAR